MSVSDVRSRCTGPTMLALQGQRSLSSRYDRPVYNEFTYKRKNHVRIIAMDVVAAVGQPLEMNQMGGQRARRRFGERDGNDGVVFASDHQHRAPDLRQVVTEVETTEFVSPVERDFSLDDRAHGFCRAISPMPVERHAMLSIERVPFHVGLVK
jgi:hypothetical protein